MSPFCDFGPYVTRQQNELKLHVHTHRRTLVIGYVLPDSIKGKIHNLFVFSLIRHGHSEVQTLGTLEITAIYELLCTRLVDLVLCYELRY